MVDIQFIYITWQDSYSKLIIKNYLNIKISFSNRMRVDKNEGRLILVYWFDISLDCSEIEAYATKKTIATVISLNTIRNMP